MTLKSVIFILATVMVLATDIQLVSAGVRTNQGPGGVETCDYYGTTYSAGDVFKGNDGNTYKCWPHNIIMREDDN